MAGPGAGAATAQHGTAVTGPGTATTGPGAATAEPGAATAEPGTNAAAHAGQVLILDFGSQYTRLIARRVREAGVYCEIQPWNHELAAIRKFAPHGIILSGGPETVTAAHPPRLHPEIFEMGVPVLGICYGMQAMVQQLGGAVEQGERREFGHAEACVDGASPLFDRIEPAPDRAALMVWMSHGDRVTRLPDGFTTLAHSANSPHVVIADARRRMYGIQFHPEVTHTACGRAILQAFTADVCNCPGSWAPANIARELVAQLRERSAGGKVLLALSGGVDSAVAAALLHRAIGERLVCVFVDNGLLRLGEAQQVLDVFKDHLGVNIIHVDAGERFFTALTGVADPEQKRKIIGRLFIEIFEQQAARLDNIEWLAQGTIYPDVIESAGAGSAAHVIKSHHNVGGLPERMRLRLLEPLRELFKDEVRAVGLELGLPHKMVYRHPFPGPGLGVRILGEVKREYADILRQADAIFLEELERHELYHEAAQAFAVFLPVKSVGVMGDGRTYEYVIALRAVCTTDFMTAECMRMPWEVLQKVSSRILNEVRRVSRVAYDVSSKPPATIEWE